MMDFNTAKSSTANGNGKPLTAKLGLLKSSRSASETLTKLSNDHLKCSTSICQLPNLFFKHTQPPWDLCNPMSLLQSAWVSLPALLSRKAVGASMQPSRPRATSAARVPPIRTAAGNPAESVNKTRFLLAMWISTLSYTPSASLIYALPNFNCFSLGIRILDMTSKLHVVIQQSVYCVSCIIHLSVQHRPTMILPANKRQQQLQLAWPCPWFVAWSASFHHQIPRKSADLHPLPPPVQPTMTMTMMWLASSQSSPQKNHSGPELMKKDTTYLFHSFIFSSYFNSFI